MSVHSALHSFMVISNPRTTAIFTHCIILCHQYTKVGDLQAMTAMTLLDNDNFGMNTGMVDMVLLIIWLIYFDLMMKNFRCCQRIQQRQSYKLRVHGVNPQSPLKV
jgi:hypothetical protein